MSGGIPVSRYAAAQEEAKAKRGGLRQGRYTVAGTGVPCDDHAWVHAVNKQTNKSSILMTLKFRRLVWTRYRWFYLLPHTARHLWLCALHLL